ncbi:receptor-type tyrosine-protein phosphatase alpha-like [Mytilus edulis]|uniref:receptor-type tyrosine-protein phosphatase alpha-like n=1 Tax=Mytilus edulis TaxID=6550 RepID=UPI0039F1210A
MKGWTGDSCNYTTECVLKTYDTTYKGTVNTTKSSLPCKRWEKAQNFRYHALEENFCRNPSFDRLEYPWCYVESGNPYYERCSIPLCVCQPGFFGQNCQSKCHCAVDGCATITGECDYPTAGCKLSWTGRNCSKRFSCPDLQTRSTSNLLTSPSLTGNHINDTVKFGCDVGYALSGPDTLLCIINDSHNGGKWSNIIPICQSIACSKRSLHLTSTEVMHAKTEVFIFEEVVNISCKQGYIGEVKQSKCVNLNKWNGNRPVCRAIPCPDFNKTESIELPTNLTKYHFSDIAIFKCRSGYILSGNDTLTCLAYNLHPVGKWSSVQPICIDNSSNAFPAAAVGGGVGSVVAIILIALIIVFLVKRRTLKHKPQKSTVYRETPLKSTVAEETELKRDSKKCAGVNDRGIIVSVNNDNTYYNKVEVEGDYNNEEEGEGYYSFTLDKQIPRSAVLMKEFYDYVENGREVGGKLEMEFAKLHSGLQKPTHSALKPGNKLKNKYKNMYAYDETRVVLDVIEGSPLSDYINASFIHGYGRVRKYIASQGPLDNTVNDFWRMVWQCDCGKIVMLTNIFEEGKHKCIQYWPEEENHKVSYGAIDIFLIKEEVYSDFVVRIIKMQKGSESKVVKQFHFTVWPDKNVPKYSSSLVHFRHKVNNTEVSCTGPMVVHCSAGIGRTGTFIGLDYVANQAKEVEYVDVFGCVEGLRRQRVNMVQTQRQYVFLHDAVLEALMCPNAGIPSKDFQEDYNKLLEFDSIKKKVKLRVQYEAMNKISRRHEEEEFDKGKSLENKTKNRYSNIMPVGSEIPLLSTAVDGHNEYINAVFLPGYKNSKAFIVTQMPLEDTKVDLWRLVYDYNISSIVMLNQSYDSRDVYWPVSGESSVTSGPFIIEQINIETSRLYQLLQLKIGYNNKDQRNLKIFQAKFWSDSDVVPKDSSDIFSFIDVVENDCNNSGPVLVHCLNGCDKSGLYCVLATVIERLRIEQDVDIQHIIKQMRNMRPQIIPNYEQFQFIYEAVIEYLQDFETYSNFQ